MTTAIKEETSKYVPPPFPGEERAAAPAPATEWDQEAASPSAPHSSTPPEDLDISPSELKELEKWNMILRVSFMAISILMATASVLALQNASLGTFVIAIYVFFFAIVICCFELSLKGIAMVISENFGFMYTKSGKVIFIVFISVMCFDLKVMGKVCMALLLLAVCVNIYVIITLPKYEKWLRKKHYSHILDKSKT